MVTSTKPSHHHKSRDRARRRNVPRPHRPHLCRQRKGVVSDGYDAAVNHAENSSIPQPARLARHLARLEFRANWAIPQPKSLNPLPFIEPPCCTGGRTGANLEAAVIDGFVLSGPERDQAPTSVGASLGIGLLRSIQNGAYPPLTFDKGSCEGR